MPKKPTTDERIIVEIQKYGSQARIIMSFLLAIDIFYKILIQKCPISQWLFEALIFIFSYLYFIVRCTLGGIILFPDESSTKKRMWAAILITGIGWVAVTVLIFLFFNPLTKSKINSCSSDGLLIILAATLIGLVTYSGLIWTLSFISKRITEKKIE